MGHPGEPVDEPDLDPALLDLLDAIPETAVRPRLVTPLPGGLTNVNVKVTTARGTYVARRNNPSDGLLGIDREAEYRNSVAAAAAGVGAPVIGRLPDHGLLVLGWIEARTCTAQDLVDPELLARVGRAARTLHQGPEFLGRLDMRALQRRYRATVAERGFRLPAGYDDLAPQASALASALDGLPTPIVPCHNDLLPANILDDGTHIWLIDYEYAAMGDPDFELGNLWSEAGLDVAHLELLVASYYGQPDPTRVARARLWGVMAQYGWMLWAAIQDGSSSIEFDFWNWGLAKYDRAAAELTAAGFSGLLDAAAAS